MDTFRVKAVVAAPHRPEERGDVEFLVDTGATYTWIPAPTLEALGVTAARAQPVRLADGRIVERGFAWILLTLDGRTEPTPCLIGAPGSEPLLGAVTLEIFGLGVDPLNRRLIPVIPPMAAADASTALVAGSPPLKLILPLPPSVNHQYATVDGKRVLSWEAKRYKKKTIERLKRLVVRGWLPKELLEALRRAYLSLSFDFYFKTSLRRDLDGGLKIAQDVLCQAFAINDNRVVQALLNKRIDPTNPRLEVEVRSLPAWEFTPEPTSADPPEGLLFDLSHGLLRRGRTAGRERSLEELARSLGWELDSPR